MESSEELRERIRVAERAAAAPYVDYPPTPWWYSPGFGAWAAALLVLLGLPGDRHGWRAAGIAGLVLVEVVFIAWYRRYRGTWPSGKAPDEIRRVMVGFVIGTVVVLGAGVLLVWLTPVAVAAVAGFVMVTAGIAWYERAYARAAARTRERLGVAA